MKIDSKLPEVGTTIFTVMSALAAEHQAINLAQGFPNFDPPSDLLELLKDSILGQHHQYAPMAGLMSLRESIAEKFQITHNKHVNPETEICITSGASEALFSAIQAFIKSGDEVVCIEPCYDLYKPAIKSAGGVYIPYVCEAPDFNIDWTYVQSLFTSRTRMIIINSPNNPSGKTFSKEDLDQLSKITADTNIIVLSDEVYEHITFDGNKHNCTFAHDVLKTRTISAFSFGKTYHCTGWKIGYCLAPKNLMNEFKKIHQFNVFSVPHFPQVALAKYLKNKEVYLSLSSFYEAKRNLFEKAMKDSKFRALPSSGSFFQLYDYSAISDLDDMAFAQNLTIEHGVAGIPVSSFYSTPQDSKLIRFCFAKTDDILLKAADKLKIL